jgi:general stress protein 26
MNQIENLYSKDAIDKLKILVEDIVICLFCSELKSKDGSKCRPMSAIEVCSKGNIWFFSEKDSDKNKSIERDKNVQLYFSHPAKNEYLVVNGIAEIIYDKLKIDELWTPVAKIWFEEGKEDSSISIIKVSPSTCYYWDTGENKMISFLKLAASIVTGDNLVTGTQGELKV